jgi:hypothetical protein
LRHSPAGRGGRAVAGALLKLKKAVAPRLMDVVTAVGLHPNLTSKNTEAQRIRTEGVGEI